MEPLIIIILYFLAMYGMWINEPIIVAAAVIGVFFSAKDFTVPFLLSIIVMYGAKLIIPERSTWGAVGMAVAVLTMMLAGMLKEKKSKEEEIPPEMIPYLLAMYGGGQR